MTILEVGVEGGTLAILGEKNASGSWRFWWERDEIAAFEALCEEDRPGLEPRDSSKQVDSLAAAIAKLDRYPWFRFWPLEIHPEFEEAILLEVKSRSSMEEQVRWEGRLGEAKKSVAVLEQPKVAIANYTVGALVEVRGKQDWGPGKIVDVVGDKVHVIFRNREERNPTVLKINAPALHLAAVQSDPVLENLPPLVEGPNGLQLPKMRLPLEQAKHKFLRHFPGGFSDERYLFQEREYRLVANRRFREVLKFNEVKRLLAHGDTELVISRASSILNSVGLVAPFECAAFHDAMCDRDAAHGFYIALFSLLDAPEVNQKVFEPYLDAVLALLAKRGKVATWPIATVLLYVAQPERFLFLKPKVTQSAAETLGFNLYYVPSLNWTTYSALLRMGGLYLDLLRPMGARDLIDVQTFIFGVGGSYD